MCDNTTKLITLTVLAQNQEIVQVYSINFHLITHMGIIKSFWKKRDNLFGLRFNDFE